MADFDLLLPGCDDGKKCRALKLIDTIRKELNINVPVIFLTAKSAENDLLTGFNLGADDYVTKPYSLKELIARVKVALRRNVSGGESNKKKVIQIDQMMLDLDTKNLTIADERVDLTRKEFEILRLLFENKTKIFSREEILVKIWGDDVVVTDRTVDVNITRLRKKLKKIWRVS